MKRWLTTTIALVCAASSVTLAQPDSLWSNVFGGSSGEACYSVIQSSDGGYVLAGYTQTWGAGWNDFWVVKTNANGDSLWSRTFGGGDNNICEEVVQTADGGLAFIGKRELWENNAYNDDFWLIRTNSSGDSIWSRTYGGLSHETAYSLQLTNDGGFLIGGMGTIYGVPLNFEMVVTRASASGDSLWSRRFGGPNEERCYCALQTSDGGYLAAGKTHSFGYGTALYSDYWIVKMDADGDSLWGRTYGGEYTDECIAAVQTNDGGYALAGTTASFGVGVPGYLNYWLVRLNANGDTLWTKAYGGEGSDRCEALLLLDDGGFLLSGTTMSFGSGNGDMWMVRTNANGEMLWNRTFGGSDWDRGYCVAKTSDGGYVVAGETSSFGFVDMWMVKTGPDGGGGSETEVVSEGFETGCPPAGWVTSQIGASSLNWHALASATTEDCGNEAHTGTNAAFHDDDAGTGETDVHDLLIAPEVYIPQNAVEVQLRFFQRNCYVPNYYTDSTHHWVQYMINDGPWTLLAELETRQEDWAEVGLVIPGATGQQLRVAFDYQGDYATEWYIDDVTIVVRLSQDAERPVRTIPLSAELQHPYPNPFNPVTQIVYELPTPTRMTLKVFDLIGREVAVLADGFSEAGRHVTMFDGGRLPSGIYFVRLDAGAFAQTRKAMLIK